MLSARRKTELELVAKECLAVSPMPAHPAIVLPLDLSADLDYLEMQAKEVHSATAGRVVDVLINCAGLSSRSPAVETALATDVKMMHINFLAPVVRHQIPHRCIFVFFYDKFVLTGSLFGHRLSQKECCHR